MVFLYEKGKNGIRILRVFGEEREIQLPDEICGEAVTELGDYLFSDRMDRRELQKAREQGSFYSTDFFPGRELTENCRDGGQSENCGDGGQPEICGEKVEEVFLPRFLRRIGRYAFYNCKNLKKLSFFGELTDLGAGAFTGCHRIRKLQVQTESRQKSCLRELLMELPEEMRVDYRKDGQQGRFWFPEFFEEGVENTPARILETHVHGSGMRYRNCFQDRELNIREYDRQFYYAVTEEREELAVELAMGRIRYPMELTEKAAEAYRDYLREHFSKTAELLLGKREYGEFGILLKLLEPSAKKAEQVLLKVENGGDAQGISILMDYLREKKKPKRKVFEL